MYIEKHFDQLESNNFKIQNHFTFEQALIKIITKNEKISNSLSEIVIKEIEYQHITAIFQTKLKATKKKNNQRLIMHSLFWHKHTRAHTYAKTVR